MSEAGAWAWSIVLGARARAIYHMISIAIAAASGSAAGPELALEPVAIDVGRACVHVRRSIFLHIDIDSAFVCDRETLHSSSSSESIAKHDANRRNAKLKSKRASII